MRFSRSPSRPTSPVREEPHTSTCQGWWRLWLLGDRLTQGFSLSLKPAARGNDVQSASDESCREKGVSSCRKTAPAPYPMPDAGVASALSQVACRKTRTGPAGTWGDAQHQENADPNRPETSPYSRQHDYCKTNKQKTAGVGEAAGKLEALRTINECTM